MGMDEITSRDLVSLPHRTSEVMGTSFYLRLLGGCIGSTLCCLVAYYLHHNNSKVFLFIALYSFAMIFKSLQVVENYYLSRQDLKRLTMQRNLIFVVLSMIKLGLIYLNKTWDWFVIAAVVEVMLFGAAYIYTYVKDGMNLLEWRIDKLLLRSYLKGSLLVFFTGLVTMGISRIDQIMIQNLAGSSALGEYAAAVKLIETWQFIPLGVVSALYAKIVKAKKQGEREYHQALEQLYGIIFGGSLLLAISTSIFGLPISKIIYGVEYSKTGEILIFYSWTVVASYFSVVRAKIFVIEGGLKEIALVTFLIFSLNFCLNYYLIPLYSSTGAVIASLASYLLGNILYALFNPSARVHFVIYLKSLRTIPSLISELLKPSSKSN